LRIVPDNWLSGIFGYPSFKIEEEEDSSGISNTVTSDRIIHSSGGESAFFYARISTNRIDTMRSLLKAGFYVVDVSVTFERKPDYGPVPLKNKGITVRRSVQSDRKGVIEIASTSFVFSRFHQDPDIGVRLANEVKRAWMESYFRGERGSHLLVATREEKPVGFLAVVSAAKGSSRIMTIDLVGVGKAHQRHGIGRVLVETFISDSAGKCELMRVGTQAANIPSINLYEELGFRVAETGYVLHAHVRDGKVLR
jgi:ribosomal protein S18 acetylase RimI-like enzyme